jgi:hypothetical protein
MSEIKYTEDTEFKKGEIPNANELKLFENEKMELYKGTFVVCIVYGLSAFLLLIIILFTEWGREYIYNKFAPAVITYILGSLIIVIYLLNAIFTLQPRKVGRVMDGDNNILCPDYWKLEEVPEHIKEGMIYNNVFNVNNNIIPEINRTPNTKIKYRCVFDKNVYGNTEDHKNMKNNLHGVSGIDSYYASGFNSSVDANKYIDDITAKKTSTIDPDYVVVVLDKEKSVNYPYYKDLKKYAMFTGGYSSNNDKLFDSNSSNVLRVVTESLGTPQPKYDQTRTPEEKKGYHKGYDDYSPLICNVVYPQVLGLLDANTKDKNEISCQYANLCGVSWSSLKCNQEMTLIKE